MDTVEDAAKDESDDDIVVKSVVCGESASTAADVGAEANDGAHEMAAFGGGEAESDDNNNDAPDLLCFQSTNN